jgi:hypothetical protein
MPRNWRCVDRNFLCTEAVTAYGLLTRSFSCEVAADGCADCELTTEWRRRLQDQHGPA